MPEVFFKFTSQRLQVYDYIFNIKNIFIAFN